MAEHPDSSTSKFKKILAYLVTVKKIKGEKVDVILQQYQDYLQDFVMQNRGMFLDFNPASGKLDNLFSHSMRNVTKYKDLWGTLQMLILLSHGQAAVERGFSVNRQVDVENLKEITYASHRVICDHLLAVGGLENVTVTKGMLLSAGSARQKYHAHLDEQRRQKEKAQLSMKKRTLCDELEELKGRKKRLKLCADNLLKSANDLVYEAEVSGEHTVLAKSNSFRRSAEEKEKQLLELNEEINKKLMEIKEA